MVAIVTGAGAGIGRAICRWKSSYRAYFTNYGAMKGGVLSFTRTLATELAPFGVTANSVNPGYLFTELWEHTAKLIAKALDTDTPPTAEQIFTSIATKSTPMVFRRK